MCLCKNLGLLTPVISLGCGSCQSLQAWGIQNTKLSSFWLSHIHTQKTQGYVEPQAWPIAPHAESCYTPTALIHPPQNSYTVENHWSSWFLFLAVETILGKSKQTIAVKMEGFFSSSSSSTENRDVSIYQPQTHLSSWNSLWFIFL